MTLIMTTVHNISVFKGRRKLISIPVELEVQKFDIFKSEYSDYLFGKYGKDCDLYFQFSEHD
jgi:hypothetical protein